MLERLKYKGLLVEKRIELKKLKLQIDGLIIALRSLLDPFCETLELNGVLIARQALDLSEYQAMYRECFAEISKLEEAIG